MGDDRAPADPAAEVEDRDTGYPEEHDSYLKLFKPGQEMGYPNGPIANSDVRAYVAGCSDLALFDFFVEWVLDRDETCCQTNDAEFRSSVAEGEIRRRLAAAPPDLEVRMSDTIVANGGQKIDVNPYIDGCVHIGVLYEGRGSQDPDYSLGFVLSPDAIRQLQAALAQIALDATGGAM